MSQEWSFLLNEGKGATLEMALMKEEIAMNVTWDSEKCCHSGNCVTALPEAFFIENETLVVKPERASEEEVRAVVAACPAKAFTIDSDG